MRPPESPPEDLGRMEPPREIEKRNKNYPPKFWLWLADNEHIYKAFVQFAMQMKRAGKSRYSASGIVERIRWETHLQQRGDITFKFDENMKPGLARLAMAEHAVLKGFFELRPRK